LKFNQGLKTSCHQPVRRSLALLTIFLGCNAVSARAGLLLDFTGGFDTTFGGNATVGWEFTVSSPMLLSGLGYFDFGANGLANAHDVGIWNSANPSLLLASTTVTSGSTPVSSISGAGQWLFNSITSITLSPGTYVLGATIVANDTDRQFIAATAATISGATFVQGRDISSTSLLYPSPAATQNDGIFGPNAEVSPVPEPCSATLIALGFGALWWRKK